MSRDDFRKQTARSKFDAAINGTEIVKNHFQLRGELTAAHLDEANISIGVLERLLAAVSPINPVEKVAQQAVSGLAETAPIAAEVPHNVTPIYNAPSYSPTAAEVMPTATSQQQQQRIDAALAEINKLHEAAG